jgi:hypothetical protein
MEITKKVLALGIVEQVYDNNGEYKGKRLLFWVIPDKQNQAGTEKLLSQRMITTTSLSGYPGSNCKENLNRDKCCQYLNQLFAKAYHNELKVYKPVTDFNAGIFIPMTGEELHKFVTTAETFHLTRNYPPYSNYDTIIKTEVIPGDLNELRFIEEWYFNPETMFFVKKVIGISVLQADYGLENVENKEWIPLFDVYFNDIWQPFDRKIIIKK